MIKTIYPMLASGGKNKDLWENDEWWAEEKIDGSRYLMHIGKKVNRFTSRQKSRQTGLPVEKTENVPHLSLELDLSELAGTILDGEMQHSDFGQTISIMGSLPDKAVELQKKIGNISYHAFDVLEYKGQDVRHLPYHTRRSLLDKIINQVIEKDFYCFLDSPTVVKKDKKAYYKRIIENGGEGVILKHIHGKYEDNTRSKEWIKVKKYITDDVVIMGSDLPTKNYTGKSKVWRYWETVSVNGDKYLEKVMTIEEGCQHFCIPITKPYFMGWIGAIKFGKYVDGELKELGQTSGINDKMKELLSDGSNQIKQSYIGQVIEIGAMEQLKSGAYRHPRFLRLRKDKNAEECIWEVE